MFLECLEVLKTQARDENHKPKGFNQQTLVFKMLNHLAEAGEVEQLKDLFTVLRERNLAPITSVVLGPLVKVHILRFANSSSFYKNFKCRLVYIILFF